MTTCSRHVLFSHHGPPWEMLLSHPEWSFSIFLQIHLHSPPWADTGMDMWPKLDQSVPFPRILKLRWETGRQTDKLIPFLTITLSHVRLRRTRWHDVSKMEKASLSRWEPIHQERPRWEGKKVQSDWAGPASLASEVPEDRPLLLFA